MQKSILLVPLVSSVPCPCHWGATVLHIECVIYAPLRTTITLGIDGAICRLWVYSVGAVCCQPTCSLTTSRMRVKPIIHGPYIRPALCTRCEPHDVINLACSHIIRTARVERSCLRQRDLLVTGEIQSRIRLPVTPVTVKDHAGSTANQVYQR